MRQKCHTAGFGEFSCSFLFDLDIFHISSIYPLAHSSVTLKEVCQVFYEVVLHPSGSDSHIFSSLTLTRISSITPTHHLFQIQPSFTLSAPNALLLLNYFTAPWAMVDCEKFAWCKGPLMHVLMDLDGSSQWWDMWLIVAACSLPEQQGHTGAAGGEEHFDLPHVPQNPPYWPHHLLHIHNIYQVHTSNSVNIHIFLLLTACFRWVFISSNVILNFFVSALCLPQCCHLGALHSFFIWPDVSDWKELINGQNSNTKISDAKTSNGAWSILASVLPRPSVLLNP